MDCSPNLTHKSHHLMVPHGEALGKVTKSEQTCGEEEETRRWKIVENAELRRLKDFSEAKILTPELFCLVAVQRLASLLLYYMGLITLHKWYMGSCFQGLWC